MTQNQHSLRNPGMTFDRSHFDSIEFKQLGFILGWIAIIVALGVITGGIAWAPILASTAVYGGSALSLFCFAIARSGE